MTFVGHIWLTLHVLASSKLLLVSSEALTTVSAAAAAGGGGTGMSNRGEKLLVQPAKISITIGEHSSAEFYTNEALDTDVELTLRSDPNFEATPHVFLMNAKERRKNVTVVGLKITSRTVLEVDKCRYINSTEECPFSNLNRTFVEVTVVHSSALSILVIVVGWIYFVAWSISFYPQIYLNFKRRSVVGLNFDFLVLNIIGFTCYTFYNVLMYFDMNVQDIYERTHPHTHIPVLLNDVVFAVHALFACIVTALQCFFYERGGQRVSYTCSGISSAFILFAVISFILSMTDVINTLQFIMFLSYVKMAVTLCKYFPQAFFNFRRKSTVGWSIGNVLLDFLGGSMDICQMILQAINTDDWSAFYGNPVKFGLGLVSMIFDIVFIIQHYVLYRNKNASLEAPKIDESRATIDANDQSSMEAAPSEDGSSVPIYVDRSNNPIV